MLDKDAIKTEITRNSIYVDGGIDHIKDDYIEVTLGDTLKVYDAPLFKYHKSYFNKRI